MASEKGNPVYKAVLRSVLKAEIQLLLNRLSENGEESLLLTATASDLQNPAPVYSKLGGRFYETDSTGFQNIGKRFQKYCQENQASMLVSTTDSNPNKKRKLEIEKSEPAEYTKLQGANGDNVQDGDNVQEVIVYVTQSDNETHTEDTKIDVSSSGSRIIAGSAGFPGYSQTYTETVSQTTISEASATTADSESESQEVVVLAQSNDDQSKMLWMDYMPNKSSDADGNPAVQETVTNMNHGELPPDSKEHLETATSYNSSVAQESEEVQTEDILEIAMSDSLGEPGRILLRNQATNKFISIVPISSSSTGTTGKATSLLQGQSFKQVKGVNQSVVKRSPATSYSGYLNRMSSGKSIMIRAGEDAFEEIQTLRVPDTYEDGDDIQTEEYADEASSTILESSIVESDSQKSAADEFEEPLTVETTQVGEKIHIVKNPTTENELLYERSDLPFEQMFDLLGKSARCLVCGKIMLKRNRRYHWRFHAGVKPYTCSYCGKEFYHPSNLKTHLFIHTARNK